LPCIVGNCPELFPPDNGAVSYSGDGVVSIAEYTCNTGYSLIGGDLKRFCNNDDMWNGTAPSCSDGEWWVMVKTWHNCIVFFEINICNIHTVYQLNLAMN